MIVTTERETVLPAPPPTEPLLSITRGRGTCRFLLVPGLVPDGPETFERQKRLFLAHGDVVVVTYPTHAFSMSAIQETIERFVRQQVAAGHKPVLVGVSVGGSFVLEYLRRQKEQERVAPLAGLILISPLTCPEDLAPLLRKLWNPIVSDEGTPQAALEKGRSFFKSLVARSQGKATPRGWKGLLSALTPQGIIEIAESGLRKRIEQTLQRIPAQGAIDRCRALRELPGIHGLPAKAVLCEAPTLILWGSRERHTLDMDGPGVRLLCRPDLAIRFFPNLQVQWLYTKSGEEVPHASLLKHHKAFQKPLRKYLERMRKFEEN